MKNSVFLFNGMRILQDDKCHSLGLDTVLLSDFATVKKNMRVLDLGAGNGALSFLLAGREKTAEFDGIEISDAACALADENISLNGMRDNIKIHRADFCSKDLPLEPNSFDLAVSNPPYFAYGSGKKAEGARGLARSESACSLPGLLKTAARFLKWGGYFAVVYRPERLSELIFCMKENKIEPKRMRFVMKDPYSKPSLVLLEGKLHASAGLNVLPPLYTKSDSGGDSDEIKRIYGRGG